MEFIGVGSGLICCLGVSLMTGIIFLATAVRVVPANKRYRFFRLGQEIGEKGPGIVFLIPIIDRAELIDHPSGNVRHNQ